MKIINHDILSKEKYFDPVKTEQNIQESLINVINDLPNNFNYVNIPLAQTINKYGIHVAQQAIDDIEKKYNGVKKFVCQHILVNKLNFYDNIVFTPHAIFSDNRICIPHYNNFFDRKDAIDYNKRKYKTSFIGSSSTHNIRKELFELNNNNDIIVRDTGNWFYEKPSNDRGKYSNKFKEYLLSSKLSLCPQGTGPSTIRLYESMAVGSIPIIFNDVKVPTGFEKYVIRLNSVNQVNDLNAEKYIDLSKSLHIDYWNKISNYNVYKILINHV
tara:strand:+ start:1922 stop:2734 length:813 start_codon:yes stop_codon:yes gene_type:complete